MWNAKNKSTLSVKQRRAKCACFYAVNRRSLTSERCVYALFRNRSVIGSIELIAESGQRMIRPMRRERDTAERIVVFNVWVSRSMILHWFLELNARTAKMWIKVNKLDIHGTSTLPDIELRCVLCCAALCSVRAPVCVRVCMRVSAQYFQLHTADKKFVLSDCFASEEKRILRSVEFIATCMCPAVRRLCVAHTDTAQSKLKSDIVATRTANDCYGADENRVEFMLHRAT